MADFPSRRSFLKSATLAGSAIGMSAVQYARVYGANSRLGIASVGTGNRGWADLTAVAASPSVDVIALCDIDSSRPYLGRAALEYPAARQYADWRRMLDDSQDIHGVLVSTPDFMHAPISMAAMHLGKHIFCQKPLAHSVYETRQMQQAAEKFKLVTQMCNQIQSHSAYRTAVHMVQAGLIGKVKEVHSWQGGSPPWPRNTLRPTGSDPVPSHVRWDLWQGVAAERPYKEGLYHPRDWRGWQDYGSGQLGDFACHILDPVFQSLELSPPMKLTAQAPQLLPETWTDRCTVHYEFPGTEFTHAATLPVTWYDAAGATPPRGKLAGVPANYELPVAGSVLVGDQGAMVLPHVGMPQLFPEEKFRAKKLPVIEGVDHFTQWADACLGNAQTTSHFGYAGPLTEAVLLGTIGIRFPEQELAWDAEALKITNHPQANEWLTKVYRQGWEPAWV